MIGQNVSASLQFFCFDGEGWSGKPQINPLRRQGKRLEDFVAIFILALSFFSSSDTVFLLNLGIYPSICKAQSSVQEK